MNKPNDADVEQFLLCSPDFFNIEYIINPWMEGNIGKADSGKALEQWNALRDLLSSHARVELIGPETGLPDMVFTANAGLVLGSNVVLSHFAYAERQPEEIVFRKWFERRGFNVILPPPGIPFEGAGDALFDGGGEILWMAYGNRTSLMAHPFLAATFNIEVVSLRLVDPRFYHLDTCFLPLPDGSIAWYPGAFDSRSNRLIERIIPADKRIIVGEEDAKRFSANATIAGNMVIMNCASDELTRAIEQRGFQTAISDFSEFIKSGGSAKCLTLRLDQTASPDRVEGCAVTSREVEIRGQLIDSALLSRICDTISDSGGAFHARSMQLGQKHYEPSSVSMEVAAPSKEELETIMQRIIKLGAHLPLAETADVKLLPAPKDGVAPEGFYGTTIYPTQVRANGVWLAVENQRMDSVVLVHGGKARCSLLRDLKKDDLVVTGDEGIRLSLPSPKRGSEERFEFMTSSVSSERRVESAIEKTAWEMERVRRRGGKIVVVAGPVAIHTGGAQNLAWLAKTGYINALLGGNAVAVHDIETALFGTSLGVDVKSGRVMVGGHRNHIAAINSIRMAGSIKSAVEQGVISSGLFRELIIHKIPFSLAGSIRDDGPLPETKMDLIEAQGEYAKLIRGADLILSLSSMLHSIGVGNMTPSGVKLVCVDINPAVVTKLADRGSLESIGIVTDVGLFLGMLVERLKRERERLATY